jgi:hypothetical protein
MYTTRQPQSAIDFGNKERGMWVLRSLGDGSASTLVMSPAWKGIPEEIVRLCSFEKLGSLQANQTREIARRGNTVVLEKSAFFRKGKVGYWANHISEDMARKFDSIVEDKLKGSGLVF